MPGGYVVRGWTEFFVLAGQSSPDKSLYFQALKLSDRPVAGSILFKAKALTEPNSSQISAGFLLRVR